MGILTYKSTGSVFYAGSDWNKLCDAVSSGLNGILTGSACISGTTIKVLSPAGTGSPTTWGAYVQAGSGVTTAGSILWLVYPTAFVTVPNLVCTSLNTNTPTSFTGSIRTTGSTLVVSTAASSQFSWVAVG